MAKITVPFDYDVPANTRINLTTSAFEKGTFVYDGWPHFRAGCENLVRFYLYEVSVDEIANDEDPEKYGVSLINKKGDSRDYVVGENIRKPVRISRNVNKGNRLCVSLYNTDSFSHKISVDLEIEV